VQLAQALEVVCELDPVLGLAARNAFLRQVVRMADVVDPATSAPKILRLPTMPPTAVPPKFTPW
jgi:hypothetical protein